MKRLTALFCAAAAALVIGLSVMAMDKYLGADWEVSPQQIAQAKAEGKAAVETRPGTVAVLPIRSDSADMLPFKWVMIGILGGALAYNQLTRRKI